MGNRTLHSRFSPSRTNSEEDISKIDKIFENTSLVLRFKSLKEIPWKEFQDYNSLERLDLAQNQIKLDLTTKQATEGIRQLSSLKYLSLSDNQLNELPEEIGQLISLEELILSTNYIEKLPPSLSKLKKLKHLDVFLNKIEKLDLSSFDSLKKLSASFNFIKEIDMSHSKELEYLDLSSNE